MILIAYTYIFWLLFIVVMAGKAAWPQLPIVARVLLAPAALVGYLMDVFFNLVIATILFLDLPREWTFTERLDRYKQEGGWRGDVAKWICSNLLDPFQVGGHCR